MSSSNPFISLKAEGPDGKPIDIPTVERVLKKPADVVAFAATSSIKTITADIPVRGRAAIRASGGKFTGKWITGLQARQYPKRKKQSAFAKVYINHRLGGVASVFERGAHIKGRPKGNRKGLLWIPLPGTPKNLIVLQSNTSLRSFKTGKSQKRVAKRATASRIGERRGGLEYAKPGKYPLLGYYTGRGEKRKFKALFYGIYEVDVPRKISKWGIVAICKEEAKRLPSLFSSALKDNASG